MQTNEENLYRLEQLFENNDSINIVRKQVERYEELLKEQVERMGKPTQNSERLDNLKQNMKTPKR